MANEIDEWTPWDGDVAVVKLTTSPRRKITDV
jgi:hypothetical protein